MCHHHNVRISPTEENSWGIADTYHIKCTSCHKIVSASVSLNEAAEFLTQNNYHFVSDNNYQKHTSDDQLHASHRLS